VQGYGESALAAMDAAGGRAIPAASQDHSKANPTRNQPVMLTLLTRPPAAPPTSACAESPLAGFDPGAAVATDGHGGGCCS
jgi:hypothetical protein